MYDVLELTEDMVSGMVKAVTGGYKTKYHTQSGEVYDVRVSKKPIPTNTINRTKY
jgi:lysyl-tRNA synthetase class 2